MFYYTKKNFYSSYEKHYFSFVVVLQEAEKEMSLVSAEKEKALQDLQDAIASHDKKLAER